MKKLKNNNQLISEAIERFNYRARSRTMNMKEETFSDADLRRMLELDGKSLKQIEKIIFNLKNER